MNAMTRIFLILLLVVAVPSPAESTSDPELEKAITEGGVPTSPIPVPAAPTSLPLVDLFSAEKNPGRGTLEYVKGSTPMKIQFGSETGHYVMGMVFSHDTLPPSIRAGFKNNEVIQLAFGTAPGTLGSRVAQFGAATLLVLRGKQSQRTVPFRIPGTGEGPLPESGFLLFTSPEMQAQQSDEEKLKGTFFARSGSVTINSTAPSRAIQVTAEGKKIPFKMQAMRMDIHAALGTPFNSEEHVLQGQIEFPLYWPQGQTGKNLARRLAENSFNTRTSIQLPDEMAPAQRQVTGKPSRKK